jgi:predicted DNA-binding transcriptional regulator AlpA
LLTARQAAESLSICEKTLWSITMPRGPLRAVKIGRSVRYSIQDLREFIEAANAAAGK